MKLIIFIEREAISTAVWPVTHNLKQVFDINQKYIKNMYGIYKPWLYSEIMNLFTILLESIQTELWISVTGVIKRFLPLIKERDGVSDWQYTYDHVISYHQVKSQSYDIKNI